MSIGGFLMPFYCKHCDEFFKYNFFRGKQRICPQCGGEFFAYYKNKAIACKWAPIKARCIHCNSLGEKTCPEDRDQIDPFYHKPCKQFSPKKGVKYRIE